MNLSYSVILAAASAALVSLASCAGTENGGALVILPATEAPFDMLRVRGRDLVRGDGQKVVLRGVAFGNQVYTGTPVPSSHHDEEDYARLAAMGMNSVRFYLAHQSFESDEEPGVYLDAGFAWLDQNVAWAKKHGIYLVLNMHVPFGGYQSLGAGRRLWDDPNAQHRFISLWQMIAARYAGESTIAGFDLLNEPVPTKSAAQWHELAERTIAGIRPFDAHHAVFVERVNAVAGDYREDDQRNFFRVSDPNVVYEFHFYKPFHFTHQGAPWAEFTSAESRYPDESVAEADWFLLEPKASFESARLPSGSSPWTSYETPAVRVEDASWQLGKPVLVCDANAGTASFDDLVLERLEEDGKSWKPLWSRNLDTKRGWYFWTQNGHGRSVLSTSGHGDGSALSIEKTTSFANLGADPLRFVPELGRSYRLRGFMQGENVSTDARCALRLEFFSSRAPVQTRGRAYLKQELDAYLSWGKRQEVPLYLGEFGSIRASYEGARGGLRWTSDMLDLLLEADVGFAYHAYHEEYFAFFYGNGALPDTRNQNTPLLELFTQKLRAHAEAEAAAPGALVP